MDKGVNKSAIESKTELLAGSYSKCDALISQDKQLQCPSTSTSSSDCHQVNIMSSNDSYHTNVEGGCHGPMFIGPHFSNDTEEGLYCGDNGIERVTDKHHPSNCYTRKCASSCQPNMELKDEYSIMVDATSLAPSTSIKISILNKLDPETTKEVLSQNPDMVHNYFDGGPYAPLPPLEIIYNNKNLHFECPSTDTNKLHKETNNNSASARMCREMPKTTIENTSEALDLIRDIDSSFSSLISVESCSQGYKHKDIGHTLFTYGVGGVIFNYVHKRFRKTTCRNEIKWDLPQTKSSNQQSLQLEDIEALMNMGFGAEISIEALKRTNPGCRCKIQAATQYILDLTENSKKLKGHNSQISKRLEDDENKMKLKKEELLDEGPSPIQSRSVCSH